MGLRSDTEREIAKEVEELCEVVDSLYKAYEVKITEIKNHYEGLAQKLREKKQTAKRIYKKRGRCF